eukprot:TRINITY_DN2865_c0_g1_i1.p1 TRINITY_DN2865_c0_g1~~TRINITY_DN2865_c0_g1_i1.p1  ORF type:complete len:3081 (-),score=527.33 TRINITY_DN2865_c0_g1_i1:55-9264(-)
MPADDLYHLIYGLGRGRDIPQSQVLPELQALAARLQVFCKKAAGSPLYPAQAEALAFGCRWTPAILRAAQLVAGLPDPEACFSLNFFPAYGAALLAHSRTGSFSEPHREYLVVGLDSWAFSAQLLDETSRHTSTPSAHVVVSACVAPFHLHHQILSKIADLLEVTHKTHQRESGAQKTVRGHEFSPAFLRSVAIDAVAAVRKTAAATHKEKSSLRGSEMPSQEPATMTLPLGGFTEVNSRSESSRRHTAWPLVCSAFSAILDFSVADFMMTALEETEPDSAVEMANRVFALFALSLVEEQARELTPADANADNIDCLVRALQYATQRFNLFADGPNKSAALYPLFKDFSDRIQKARDKLDAVVAENGRLPHSLRLLPLPTPELLEQCLGECSPPTAQLSAVPQVSENASGSAKSAQVLASENLSCLPLFPPSPPALVQPFRAWMQSVTQKMSGVETSSLNCTTCCLVLEGVESFFFTLAAQYLSDPTQRHPLISADERQSLIGFAAEYRTIATKWLNSTFSKHVLAVEARSRIVLLAWIVYCVMHQAACVEYPILASYAVALQPADLRHLVLSSSRAGATLLLVVEYLTRFSPTQTRRPVFSTRVSEEPGSRKFALEFSRASPDHEPPRLLRFEREEQERLISERFQDIRRKQARLAVLDPQLVSLEGQRDEAKLRLAREIKAASEISTTCKLAETRRDPKTGIVEKVPHPCHHTAEVKAAKSALEVCEQSLVSLKAEIKLNEAIPRPLSMSLPQSDEEALVVLFFTHMDQAFRLLASSAFTAQQLFVTGAGIVHHVDDKLPRLSVSWVKYFNSNKKSAKIEPAQIGPIELLAPAINPSPKISSEIRKITSKMDGIWFPDEISKTCFWPADPDPFRRSSQVSQSEWAAHLTEKVYTEQLSVEDQKWFQWAMPLLGEDWAGLARGNLPIAQLHLKPSWMRKPDFLCLGGLRAQPLAQFRRLLTGLKDDLLPLDRPVTQALIRQLLYSTGELELSPHTKKIDRLWSTGSRQWPELLDEFRAELSSWIEIVSDSPNRYRELVAFIEILTFFADKSDIFLPLREKLSKCIQGWAGDVTARIESSERHGNVEEPGLATRRCIFYALALLCFRRGELRKDLIFELVKLALQVHSARPISRPRQSAEEERDYVLANTLFTWCLQILAERVGAISTVVEASLHQLTGVLANLRDLAPEETVEWTTVAPTTQLGSTSCYRGESSAGDVFHINALTGLLLINGAPPCRLPDSILDHPLYRRCFNRSNFAVNLGKIGFRTMRQIENRFYFFFPIKPEHGGLVIRERDPDAASTLQLLDNSETGVLWCANLPPLLRISFSHWLSIDHVSEDGMPRDPVIVFRPPEHLSREVHYFWEIADEASSLCAVPPHRRRARNKVVKWQQLVDCSREFDQIQIVSSGTSANRRGPLAQILSVLGAVEDKQFVHLLRTSTNTLEFALPRLSLRFELRRREGRLYSLTHKEYFLPQQQTLPDTLRGFSTYLILQRTTIDAANLSPTVQLLVPRSTVILRKSATSSELRLLTESQPKASRSYWMFVEHPKLKHFEASSIEARLFLAVLYAATGTLLPDQRVQMTGTDYACVLVRQCFTNRPLSVAERQLLQQLKRYCGLSPSLALLACDLAQTSEQLFFLFNSPKTAPDPCLPYDAAAATAYRSNLLAGVCNQKARLTPSEVRRISPALNIPQPRRRLPEMRLSDFPPLPDPFANVLAGSLHPALSVSVEELEDSIVRFLNSFARHLRPAEVAPPFPLDISEDANKLELNLIDRLESSWRAEHILPQHSLSSDVAAQLLEILPSFSKRVEHARKFLQAHLLTLVDSFGFGGATGTACVARAALAANLRSRCTPSDLLRISFSPAVLLDLNPNFSAAELSAVVHTRVHLWMKLSVLEDRLERLHAMASLPLGESRQDFLYSDLSSKREWSTANFPRWLVFEFVGRLQIRPQQYNVVRSLLDDPGRIEQLNMGQGKTRVLVPMLVLAWADGQRCARLHFLPQLLTEAYDHLHRYLCASELQVKLARLPFHRDVRLNVGSRAQTLLLFVEDVIAAGGALIVAPEHRLSRHLKELELRLLTPTTRSVEEKKAVQETLEVLAKLEKLPYCDIFDECDALLSHKYQLIYAAGSQIMLPDLSPRSVAVRALLSALIRDPEVTSYINQMPSSCVQVSTPAAMLDHLGRQRGAHEHSSVSLVAGPELENHTSGLHQKLAQAVFKNPPREVEDWVVRLCQGSSNPEQTMQHLVDAVCDKSQSLSSFGILQRLDREQHLPFVIALRGLLGYGTFVHALTLRHNVDYGIDQRDGRTRLAVPYRASQTPSERAEYAHSDLALVLTFLSYMMDGLSESQTIKTFELLLEQHKNTKEKNYFEWFRRAKLGISEPGDLPLLDHARKLDLSNPQQRAKIFRYFSRCPETVWFYLNKCVLPDDTKTFPHRLTSTPWDLCHATHPKSRRCGFSGTNDTAIVMPLQVHQGESTDGELHRTNGKMLATLLACEQCVEVSVDEPQKALRRAIFDLGCSAFIDAGALMCGLSNEEVATTILELLKEQQQSAANDSGSQSQNLSRSEGVVFVSDGEWVTWDLNGGQWLKHDAPLAEQDAFVYFDECHTRGADIKMRPQAVAMLTVSKKLQKDGLMQAAGRMRQLSRDQQQQRLVLAVMSDAAAKLRKDCGLADEVSPGAKHVVQFVLKSTARFLRGAFPAWAQQGIHFCRTNAMPQETLQHETLKLQQLYAPASESLSLSSSFDAMLGRPGWQSSTTHKLFSALQQKISEFGRDISVESVASAAEIERDRQGVVLHEVETRVQDECERESDISVESVASAAEIERDRQGVVLHEVETRVQDECERELLQEEQKEQEAEKEVQKPKLVARSESDWDWNAVHNSRGAADLGYGVTLSLAEFTEQSLGSIKLTSVWKRVKSLYVTRNYALALQSVALTSDVSQHLRLVDAMLIWPAGDVLLLSEREEQKLLAQAQYGSKASGGEGGALLANLALVRGGKPALLTRLGSPRLTSPLSPVLMAAIQLFAGETQFNDKRKQALKTELLLTSAEKTAALKIPAVRGLYFAIEGSDLEDATRV